LVRLIRNGWRGHFVPPSKRDVGDERFRLSLSAIAAHDARPVEKPVPLALDAVEHWRQEHQVDERRVELRATAGGDYRRRLAYPAPIAITSTVGDGVKGVGEGNDARGEWNLRAAKAAWISRSIPPFVVREDAVGEIGVEWRQRGEHLGATCGMGGDLTSLGVGEFRALVDDVEQCFVNLADIVEESDALDAAALVIVQLGGVGEDERVCGDTADVRTGSRIVGVDGIQERLESGGSESFGGVTASALEDIERAGGESGS
jgi:hypothetical protein